MTTPKANISPLFDAFIKAGEQAGYGKTDDLNGYRQEGFGPMDRTTTARGRRCSTSLAYLDQAKDRPNLTVHTRALADRILFSGQRAGGVSYIQGDHVREARARREVIVSNGAVASPQLLLRSGVGNADELRAFGIDAVVDLKGVGENLQDHLEMYLQYECTRPVSLYPALKWWNKPAIGIEWYLRGTGIAASNHFEAGGFIRSSDDFAWPNLQYHAPTIMMAEKLADVIRGRAPLQRSTAPYYKAAPARRPESAERAQPPTARLPMPMPA
ncbi:Oxygen-dependent choline dehydrogenase [compost metagenome]